MVAAGSKVSDDPSGFGLPYLEVSDSSDQLSLRPPTEIDSIVVVSFGGPEKPEDVIPFLRVVTAGRDVPEERLQLVASQYMQIGGRSPINDQAKALIGALRDELAVANIHLPIYWGNRNWHPFLADTFAEMAKDGRKHAVALTTSAYSSYSSCRQYLENISDALATSGADLRVDKIGQYYDKSGFVAPFVDGLRESYADATTRYSDSEIAVLFTAHSIPTTMAISCRYEDQLRRTAQRVIAESDLDVSWDLVFQSRSGSPHVPWLEPDINDRLAERAAGGVRCAIVVPVGFLSDHQEVIYDLDYTAFNTAHSLDIEFVRVGTPGTDPRFIASLRELIETHISGGSTVRCLGESCCLPPRSVGPPATR